MTQTEIYDTDYTKFIHLIGTVHFTQRSVREASYAVKKTGIRDLAIELDLRRYTVLRNLCSACSEREFCSAKCEFIAASDALGNINANIWLMDMPEELMRERISESRDDRVLGDHYFSFGVRDEDLPWLWDSQGPPVWRVLIQERDALMAARLAAIASSVLEKEEQPNILALVGAAHVRGITGHLQNPASLPETLKRLGLPYSPPTLVKRIHVQNG